jgi:hypothetical protein
MPTPSNETFAEAMARIAREPAHVDIPVRKIELDLSLPGILARVQFLANEAHKKGDIVSEHLQEITAAADQLKAAVAKLDPKLLFAGLPGFKGKK